MRGATKTKWLLVGAIATAVLLLDLASKRIATMALSEGESVRLLPFLSLDRTTNVGVAFGMLPGRLLLIVPAVLLGVVAILIYVSLDQRPVLAGVAGGLLLGGTLGNLAQRLTDDGRVTDFIRIPHWPTFNIADICIVAGVALVLFSLFDGGGWREPERAAPEESDDRKPHGRDQGVECGTRT